MIGSRDLPPLPEGWVWTKVGKVVSFEYGKGLRKDKRDPYGTVPVYGSNGVVGHHSKPLVEDPCLIVGRKGAVGQVHLSYSPCWPIDTTYYVVPPEGLALSFLFYLLSNLHLGSLDKSTAIPGISRSDVYAIHIPLPPLPEQHRIVAKFEELFTKLDAGIKSLKTINAQLKRYRQSVLKYAFEGKLTEEWRERHKDELEPASVLLERIKEERKKHTKGKYKELPQRDTSDLPELPEGWMWTRVGEIGQVSGGKRLPKGHKYATESTDNPYIRVTDFHNMAVKVDGLQYLNPDTHELIRKYTISKDDVYISIAGTIGRVGTIPRELDGANLTENGAKITNLSCYNNRALSYVLNSTFCQEQIARLTIHTNQPKLALFRIEQIIVPLPPLAEQHKIVEETERRFSVADDVENTVNQSLKQAERLRQSILKTAFEGKLVPQDPTDEPASVLLERIKAEKKNHKIEEQSKSKNKRKRDLVLKQRRFNDYVK